MTGAARRGPKRPKRPKGPISSIAGGALAKALFAAALLGLPVLAALPGLSGQGALPILPGLIGLGAAEAAQPRITEGGGQLRTLRLLSFNVEHFMSASTFEDWRTVCEPGGWQDPIDPRTGRSIRPDRLTYCNALDGTDGRGNRLFKAAHTGADRNAKRDALRALVGQAHADIVLFQEISDADAARELLGPGYEVVSSAELSGPFRLGQNLAIGWRSRLPLAVGEPELVVALSQAGPDGRRTRPGLAVMLTLPNGRQIAVLNVHLKAGCRMGRLDEGPSREPARADRRQADCRVFQQQVPALEAWADRRLDRDQGVIIAGDFNRDLTAEIREQLPARNDGSDRSAPPADPSRIAALLPEISDDAPRAAAFTLIRNGAYPTASQCHRNIDQFLISRNVESLLDKPFREHRVRVLPFAAPLTLDRVRPSDHCPHLLVLGLGQGTARRVGP